VEDILKRLGNVEASVGDLKTQVGVIAAAMPLLATTASVSAIPHLATAAFVSAMETRIIKWMVGTALASNGLLFIIAKCLH
jgi:hypothetical protein